MTNCGSMKTTIRKRQLWFAEALVRHDGGRLPPRIIFGRLKDLRKLIAPSWDPPPGKIQRQGPSLYPTRNKWGTLVGTEADVPLYSLVDF